MVFGYEQIKTSANYILDMINYNPEIAIILGSCLGNLSDEITNATIIDYKDIPYFLNTTVESHAGKLILGELSGKKVVCMSGRFHYYEGYDFEVLVTPIRLFKLLGVKNVILTNAAGAVNEEYKPGDIMVIKDHVKLMGASPLRGKNIEEFGPRFFDMSNAYNKDLRKLAKVTASKLEMVLQEGVYFFWMGPQFETPSEIRVIKALGGDVVGMSTVTETITAVHCGMKVLGLSLISNMAAGILDTPVTTEEVDEVAESSIDSFKSLIRGIIEEIQ